MTDKEFKQRLVNENWVREETLLSMRKQAEKALKSCKEKEKRTPGRWVKEKERPLTMRFQKA